MLFEQIFPKVLKTLGNVPKICSRSFTRWLVSQALALAGTSASSASARDSASNGELEITEKFLHPHHLLVQTFK